MFNRIYQLVIAFSLVASVAVAQQSAWQEVNQAYKTGMELYEKGKYAAAAKHFDHVEAIRLKSTLQQDEHVELTLLKENARFYQAICALELGESDAENQFLRYIKDYPASANSKAAYFQVGRSYFAKKDYERALAWFTKLDSRNLAGLESKEFRYKMGYSFFMTDDYASAKPLFEQLKDEGGTYQ
ncbi:MAG TPA: tetratricopeptide repeat protein, partial [Parapedobacter sp.]|nr:tetratricopeptide repeat protein [Parapedobacter sp.]